MRYKPLPLASVLFFALLTLAYYSGSACAQGAEEYRAGVPRNFPPHYSIDAKTGMPVGFAIDVMEEVARRSGIKVRYVVYPTWAKTLEAMETGQVDLIPNLGITAARDVHMDFTSPVETAPVVIFVRETAFDIKGIEDLNRKEVAVVEQNIGLFLMQERGGSKLLIYASQDEAFLSLISGRSDALVYPELPITFLARKSGLERRIKIVGKPLLEVKRCIAVRAGNHELLKKLDDEVQAFIKTPQYADLYTKWYGKPASYWTAGRVAVLSGGLLAFAIITLVVWRYRSMLRLNRELKSAFEERKKVEDALRESEEIFSQFLQHSPIYIFFKDEAVRAVRLSSNYETMLGKPVPELLGKTMNDLFPSELAKRMVADDLRILSEGKQIEIEEELNGRFYSTIKFPIYRDGKARYLAGFTMDITERRKLEDQLLHSQKMEAIGRLAGGIAHDFNNILTAIIGYACIAQMKMTTDDPVRANVDHIVESANRAAALTQSLLAFSRKQLMNLRPVDLNEIIGRVEKFLRRIIGEDVELKTVAKPGTLTVNADSGQIEQVLLNLATNAQDAMPKGGVFTIETDTVVVDAEYIRVHGFGKPGLHAVVIISDTGEGMDETTRKRIFEPFFTTKDMGRGTGLGLSIVYGIVQQHNGFVNVYSEPGKGTNFKIYLPIVQTPVEADRALDIPASVGGSETILLAEDDEKVRELSRQVLQGSGYTVIIAGDGEEAVRKFLEQKDRIRLAILDVVMPTLTGGAAYQEMKKIRPNIKALFISGYTADAVHIQRLLAEGMDFIQKPVAPTDFLKKVREVLDKK